MALNLPGSTTSALAIATPTPAGAGKLDPRLAAVFNQAKVSLELMVKVGDAGIETTQEFAHIAHTTEKFYLFLKEVLNLDGEARGEDIVPSSRMYTAWDICRKRTDVETETSAQRAALRLPMQLGIEDHQTAREALEKILKRELPDHKAYFEKKVGEIETGPKAEALTSPRKSARRNRKAASPAPSCSTRRADPPR